MAPTTADMLVERLIDWGVHVVFGLPGDGINGIMEALRTRQDRISFVQVRHEESAAFMACGYAKYTFDEDERSTKKVEGHTSNVWRPPTVVPCDGDLRAAAEVLNGGTRTVILAGQGAIGAATELEQLADIMAAPIVKPLLGKASVPDDSPFTTGGIGLGLCGDARATLQVLLPHIKRRTDRAFLDKAQTGMKAWRELLRVQAAREDVPMKPQVIAAALNDLLADDAIVSTDSGTVTAWAARYLQLKRGQLFSCSGNLASMAPGLPYAIASQIAYPGRQSVAFVGDGGFTMLMGEFATAVKYRLPIKVVIVKNNVLGMIKWEQMVFLGNPEYGVSLEPIDFVKFAEACGAIGFRCERPDEARPALEAMLLADGPALVEATVDPFEPPMPARMKAKQALHMAESLARGEPNRGRIALTLFRDKISDLRGH